MLVATKTFPWMTKTEGTKMDCRTYFMLCIILISATFVAAKLEDLGTVKRNKIEIKPGTHQCISDCSRLSTEGNVYMQCTVEECGDLETSDNTAQPSEIVKDEIYFEKYTDEMEERNRLALRIKWSPVDNVTLLKTKGYLINITDGVTTYTSCYHITTPMDFNNNARDEYFNDCFGKDQGTRVVLGSTITVRITALPLWKNKLDDGEVTVKVEVPDCTNEDVHSFKECETEGGRPTTRMCAESCNTTVTSYPIHCAVSKSSFRNMLGPERCEEVNKTIKGIPTPPRHIPQAQEWYKYIDPNSGDVKIALNFSWMPRMDSSLSDLHGYYMEILPSTSDFTNFNKCFIVHTHLTEEKHANATFFYDCYGRLRGKSAIEPGQTYFVHMNSLPRSVSDPQREEFTISIPSCADKSVQDVTFCQKENSKVLKGSVDAIYCGNRSAKFSYYSSYHYGDLVDIFICEAGRTPSQCPNLISQFENLQTTGTLYNISLPSSANLSLRYVVFGHGSEYPENRFGEELNFSACVTSSSPESVPEATTLIIIILIIGILCVLGILFLVIFFCRRECNLKEWITNRTYRRPQELNPNIAAGPVESPRHELLEQPSVIPPGIRVYVVFSKDYKLHNEVVHHFCSYLKYDLGLDVRLSIWEEKLVAVNPIQYMESNLKNADKVIVICSRGARDCLSETEYDGNLFTPVVRKICQQSFIGQSPGKFLVGYFPYSKQEDVPELLRDQCVMYFSLFKLMKQFEQFYFRLVGVEQYQEGGIQRIDKIAFDRYHERELTSCGMDLKLSIERMETFVHNHPTWFADINGADMPQALPNFNPRPMPSLQDSGSITDPVGERGSIVHIIARPPAGRRDQGVQRPKIQNNESLPQRHPLQFEFHPHHSAPKGGYRKMTSVTSASTNSSFIIPETETEGNSSCSLAGLETPSPEDEKSNFPYPPQKKMSVDSMSYPTSFHPESFDDNDYGVMENDEDFASSLLTNAPSNMTQITRLGLSESDERLRQELHQDIPLFQSTEDGAQISPESGVFMLANIEEDVGDIEDQIRSINESNFP